MFIFNTFFAEMNCERCSEKATSKFPAVISSFKLLEKMLSITDGV